VEHPGGIGARRQGPEGQAAPSGFGHGFRVGSGVPEAVELIVAPADADPASVGAPEEFEAAEQLTNRGAASATAHTVRADSRPAGARPCELRRQRPVMHRTERPLNPAAPT
jgi:hypothetical protein